MRFQPSIAAARPHMPLARQGGAVAIIVGISMAMLVGFVGLALDLGKLYVAKTELQNSADACALAAAQALTGASETQLAIAEAAGITTAEASDVLFQSEPVDLFTDDNVTFSEAFSGPYKSKNDIAVTEASKMRFARCHVERSQIPTWFMQVLNVMPGMNIGPSTVSASAVASWVPAQTNCALPVAICTTGLAPGTPKGTWLQGVIGPSGGESTGGGGLTGNFKWIDFTPPQGGASELGKVLTGSGTCDLPSVGTQVGQPGNVASAANDWNSRFGIYQGNVSPGSAVPDFTGYGYTEVNWPSKFNAYGDFQDRRSSNAPYQGDAATGLKTNGTISTSAYLAANGADRRMGIVPIVDCAGFASGTTAPVADWACILMLHPINFNSGGSGTGADRMFLEYQGKASDLDSPCASLGIPGDADSAGPLVPVLFQ